MMAPPAFPHPRGVSKLVRDPIVAVASTLPGLLFAALLFAVALFFTAPDQLAHAGEPPQPVRQFLESHCLDCHEGSAAEAGLDLAALPEPSDALGSGEEGLFDRWVRVLDRVADGEMPPPVMGMLEPEERQPFLDVMENWLRAGQRQRFAKLGRVRGRRLTSRQLERTLHDLLGIDIPLASLLPEEPRVDGFATVARGQPMSHFQLEDHLVVVDAALEEAFRRAEGAEDEWTRMLDAKTLSRRRPQSRTREPELIDGRAVTWSSRLAYYGRLPSTTAREGGWYRFVVRASALKQPDDHGVWCTVRSGRCVSSAPLLNWIGAFEATDQPKEWSFEAWLPAGHMLEIRPGDTTLKMARFRGGQVGPDEGGPQDVPGVAIEWIRMQRFHRGPANEAIRRGLFGDLPVAADADGSFDVVAKQPARDAARLLRRFARRAFRRPVTQAELAPYVELVQAAIADGEPFVDALRGGYRALLCSPRFLYFQEQAGPLDDHAIACRLSYLIGNTMPDEELFHLAEQGRLHDPEVLRAQLERLLSQVGERQFAEGLAAEWLDLRLIDFTQPDRRLYPEFDLVVQNSMLAETHAFLEQLFRDDLSVRHLIDSEFTYLNSRLARYYGVEGVGGDELRRVSVPSESHRGGLLTHGSVNVCWVRRCRLHQPAFRQLSQIFAAPRRSGKCWPNTVPTTHAPPVT